MSANLDKHGIDGVELVSWALSKSVEALVQLHYHVTSILVLDLETGWLFNEHLFLDVRVEESDRNTHLVEDEVELHGDARHHLHALDPAHRSVGAAAVESGNLVLALGHDMSLEGAVGLRLNTHLYLMSS